MTRRGTLLEYQKRLLCPVFQVILAITIICRVMAISSLSSGPSVVGTVPGRGWLIGRPGTHLAGNLFDREWGYLESI